MFSTVPKYRLLSRTFSPLLLSLSSRHVLTREKALETIQTHALSTHHRLTTSSH